MLSNAYFLAKFRFDTAENEPAKNLQNFAKFCPNFANFANPNPVTGPEDFRRGEEEPEKPAASTCHSLKIIEHHDWVRGLPRTIT